MQSDLLALIMNGKEAMLVGTETLTEAGHRERVMANDTSLRTFDLILLSLHNAVKGKSLKVQARSRSIWVQTLCSLMPTC